MKRKENEEKGKEKWNENDENGKNMKKWREKGQIMKKSERK